MITTELFRTLRHLAPPLAVWLVAKGYLPEDLQGGFVELLTLLFSFLGAYVASYVRDKR